MNTSEAFINTCRQFSIHAALEHSQSGNGAHVGIFFNEAIPAKLARLLGAGLLTKTIHTDELSDVEEYKHGNNEWTKQILSP